MADDIRKSYPKMPSQNWWDLRRQFARSLPKAVDADYIQSVLGLGSAKAASNLLSPLRVAGLIDEGGKPLDRANAWRHDDEYPQVCRDIINEVYPESLTDAFPPPDPDRDGVRRWFARNLQTGEANAGQLATFYVLLAEADPAAADNGPKRVPTKATAAKRSAPSKAAGVAKKVAPTKAEEPPSTPPPLTPAVQLGRVGGITVNIELQLPATADAKFFDAFFTSMRANLIDTDDGRPGDR